MSGVDKVQEIYINGECHWLFHNCIIHTLHINIKKTHSKQDDAKINYTKEIHKVIWSYLHHTGTCGMSLIDVTNFTALNNLNPILTGGGSIWPPPARNPRLRRDRRWSRHAFLWLFSFKSYASFDTKFAKIGPSVARSRNFLYSHVGSKFAQNPHFAYVCVQNTWKLLIFKKCSKTVFILSFWPFAQFLISSN